MLLKNSVFITEGLIFSKGNFDVGLTERIKIQNST